MKLVTAVLLLFLAFSQASAQLKPEFKLTKVTVFLVGAELNYSSKLTLPKGRSKLIYENISPDIADNSIRAKLSNNVKIIAVSMENVELNYDKEIKVKQDSIKLITDILSRMDLEQRSYEIEKRILTDNISRIGENQNVPVAELMTATKLFREKLKELDNIDFKLSQDRQKLMALNYRLEDEKLKLLADQSVNTKGVKKRQLVLELETQNETPADIELAYLVKDAGWSPKYNVRAETDAEKILLEYRANVYNNSGINWKNVEVTLSSANTETKLIKPDLGYAWSLDFRQENLTNAKAPGEGKLSEKQLKNENVEYVSIDAPELTLFMPLKVRYDIPADNKPHLVSVGDFTLPVEYKYFAVPKVDDNVYLIAYVRDWQKLNLIEGESSVYYNGTYLGNSYVNSRYSSSLLELSLGVDQNILLTKVKKGDHESERAIGTNRMVDLKYQIDVRNNKSSNIKLQITDQVPISGDSDIEIEVTEVSGAERDESNGKLTWNLEMKPAEQRSLVVAFSVKYPKNKSRNLNFTLFRFGGGKVMCPKFR